MKLKLIFQAFVWNDNFGLIDVSLFFKRERTIVELYITISSIISIRRFYINNLLLL